MAGRKWNWVLLIVSVLLTLLVMEAALRVSSVAKMSARFKCFDAVIGKVYCASTEGTYTKTTYSRHLVINSDGMVDREHPVSKPEGTLRVALLGDSFTASEYLHTTEKFEGILERDLSRETGRPVELLNFGISAIETWNQLQIFHLRAVKYQPDITFLLLFWGNDIRDNIGQLVAGSPNPLLDEYDPPLSAKLKEMRKNFNKVLWNSSLLYQVTHDGYGRLERSVKRWFKPDYLNEINQVIAGEYGDASLNDLQSGEGPAVDTNFNDDDPFFWDSAGWEITRELILKLKAEVEAAGSRLVLLHFPSEGLVSSGISLPHREFDAFLAQNGIPHVSLFPDYYALDHQGELAKHFIPDDGHWTRHGHRYVARRTRDMLLTAFSGQ